MILQYPGRLSYETPTWKYTSAIKEICISEKAEVLCYYAALASYLCQKEVTWYPGLPPQIVSRSHGDLEKRYRIDHAKEWVMRLYNPRVCGYPEAKPRDKCKQVGYSA